MHFKRKLVLLIISIILAAANGFAQNTNNAAQLHNIGVNYLHGINGYAKNHVEAAKYFRRAADLGLKEAQYNLALCYETGSGVTKNSTEAVKWYRKAAQQGYRDAQYNLGFHLDKGDGVAENPVEAAQWFLKAANQGNKNAMAKLASYYRNGRGVAKNDNESLRWDILAAQNGHAGAQAALAFRYSNRRPYNYAEAKKWAEAALRNPELSGVQKGTVESILKNLKKDAPQLFGNAPNTQRQATYNYPAYSHDFISGFNGAQDYGFLGLSAGYVSKQFVNKYDDGRRESSGMWPDSKSMGGVQIGFKIEPQFRYGFGLDTGLFYEYYHTSDRNMPFDGYRNADGKVDMHCLYLPAHLEWRANFSSKFQLFAYGGVGVDYCVGAKLELNSSDGGENIWTSDDFFDDSFVHDINPLNVSLEYGAGVRVSCFQLNFTMANGLLDMSDDGRPYKTYTNKNLSLALSVIF